MTTNERAFRSSFRFTKLYLGGKFMDRGELYDDAFAKAAESLQEIGKAYSTPNVEYCKDDVKVTEQVYYNSFPEPDEVNHPSRYLHHGIETIDVIKAWTEGLDGAYAFCIGNAIKYLSRWQEKGGIEDLKKAVWYIQWVIDNG